MELDRRLVRVRAMRFAGLIFTPEERAIVVERMVRWRMGNPEADEVACRQAWRDIIAIAVVWTHAESRV